MEGRGGKGWDLSVAKTEFGGFWGVMRLVVIMFRAFFSPLDQRKYSSFLLRLLAKTHVNPNPQTNDSETLLSATFRCSTCVLVRPPILVGERSDTILLHANANANTHPPPQNRIPLAPELLPTPYRYDKYIRTHRNPIQTQGHPPTPTSPILNPTSRSKNRPSIT